MKNMYRDHYCGMILEKEIGSIVRVSGYVENIRDHGGIKFVDLRDSTGYVQIVSNDETIFDDLTRESTISVVGLVRARSIDDYNDKISTGKLEILIDEITILGKAKNALPFEIITSKEVSEDVRLKYRYLDLRNRKVHDNIIFRSKVIKYLRSIMDEDDFTEIQTPIITASSPEGARDFIVPSRKFKGKFYALPQAPQIFKQLLMCSGFDKYYQIAPCFRDEDARKDRLYGEFYQLDMELAFATEEDVLEVGERVFTAVMKKFGKKKLDDKRFIRLTYKEAIDKYGTDKPDLRNPLEIIDVSEVFKTSEFKPFRSTTVKAIVVESIADKPNAWFNDLVEYANSIGMPGIGYFKVLEDMSFNGPIDKFLTDKEREQLITIGKLTPGSVIFFIADKVFAPKYAGLIRTELGRKLDLIDDSVYKFCIVKDFPMYEFSIEEDKYVFCHNPFSMPKDKLDEDKIGDILAYQYDFVCNGYEMASGAVRNHDIKTMKEVFSLVGYDEEIVKEKFGSLYTAFQYGAPPHAGMAIGIERLLMLLLDEESIREVVAFPMSASGDDKMMSSPSVVSEKQLREVHIKLR